MKKKLMIAVMTVLLCFCFCLPAFAVEAEDEEPDYVKEQLEEAGVQDIYDALDDDTKEILGALGLDDVDYDSVFNISLKGYFQGIKNIIQGKQDRPLKACLMILAVILVCAILSGYKSGFDEKLLGNTFHTAASLFVILAVIIPVSGCISNVGSAIKVGSSFMIALIPVLVGVVIASGKIATALSFNTLGLGIAEFITYVCSNFLLPMANVLLGVGIVGAVVPDFKMGNVMKTVRKYLTVLLSLLCTIFFSVLAIRGSLSGATDSVTIKTTKFMVSNFIPVIGSALSDSMSSIQSYVGVTKSVIGAFGIIAIISIYLPVFVEVLIWQVCLGVCTAASEIFELKSITEILKAVTSTLTILLIIMLFTVILFVVSLGIVLLMRGS